MVRRVIEQEEKDSAGQPAHTPARGVASDNPDIHCKSHHMKTILLSLLAPAVLLSFAACASHEPAPVSTTTTTSETHEVQAMPPATTTTTQEVHSY